MYETNLSQRQSRILSILYKQKLHRAEISKRLIKYHLISKPTLIRDLNHLIKAGYLITDGVGKSLTYSVKKDHYLLTPIDLDEYFSDSSILRATVKKDFDFEILKHLSGLILSQDETWLKSTSKSLKNQQTKLDSTIFKREIERFIIEFSWKSSKIEGNTYTLLETDVLIKQMKEAKGHPKSEAVMILNHKHALDFILKKPQRYKKLSLENVIKLHQLLTQDQDITPGIRQHPVAISGTVYVPLKTRTQILKALNQLISLINQSKNPFQKALIALSMVAYIQPFADGNKRTSRTLSNAILIAHDLYPLSLRDLDENEYLKSVILFYEQNNLFHFKRLFLEQIKFASENYFLT